MSYVCSYCSVEPRVEAEREDVPDHLGRENWELGRERLRERREVGLLVPLEAARVDYLLKIQKYDFAISICIAVRTSKCIQCISDMASVFRVPLTTAIAARLELKPQRA